MQALLHALTPVAVAGRASALKLAATVVSLGSVYSAASLLCALTLALLVTAAARRRRGRKVRLRVVLRALFPRTLFRHPSTRADLGFFLLNVLATGVLIDWAVLSGNDVSRWTAERLRAALGSAPLHALPGWASAGFTTLALFLAYEFGYYVDHWLSHRLAVRWELHKPHHAAEALTPLTLARVHPLESLVFANILALSMGLASGLCVALLGPGHEAQLAGRNAVFLLLWLAIGHLQHSNVWLTLPGPLGRWLLSPAHHQIHHSTDPADFGKNLGSFLTLFDWMFGTLRHPSRTREPLTFGVEGDSTRHHSVTGGLIDPIAAAVRVASRQLGAAARRPLAVAAAWLRFRPRAGATTSAG